MILKLGSKGTEVERLQVLLGEAGAGYKVPVTGEFDEETLDKLVYFQETHLDSKGVFLDDDGTVEVDGDTTWWALNHPRGTHQTSWFDARIPDGLSMERHLVLDRAVTEKAKGVQEEPLGSNWGPEVEKYGGGKGNPWCCRFVHWVFHDAVGYHITGQGPNGSCYVTFKAARGEDKVIETPTPGDIFFMHRRNKKGKIKGGHTGFVLQVSDDGKTFNTVEGNCGNRVKIGIRETAAMRGFVNPYKSDQADDWEHGLLAKVEGSARDTMA